MRNKILMMAITVTLAIGGIGCNGTRANENTPTGQPVSSVTPTEAVQETPEPTVTPVPTPTVTLTPEPTATPVPTPTATNTPTPTATNTPTPTATNTPTPTATNTPTPTATNTPTPTATNTPTPTATNTPTPTPTNTPKPTNTPTPTEVPVVKVNGKVDSAKVKKAEAAFKDLVKKMRKTGLVKATDVCVTMDATSIKADITLNSTDADLALYKDETTGGYLLHLDYDFIWLEGFGEKINGIDPAEYNKELLLALLSVISETPQALFDTIDLTYFSSYSLGDKSWTPVGDCYMMDAEYIWGDYFAYKIVTEVPEQEYHRDATYTMTGTGADGSKVESVVEYDSSVAAFEKCVTDTWNKKYEFPDGKAVAVRPSDEMSDEFYGYAVIRSGISSYEEYKQYLSRRILNQATSGTALTFLEYGTCVVNGYTYYILEVSYQSSAEIGYYNVIYVQISETECVEICGVWFYDTLEEYVNEVFYIR